MKLSFSTKGWHNSTFDDFCDVAQDLHFEGIELHNIYNRLFTDKDGACRLTLHQPNVRGPERARMFDLTEKRGVLSITPAGL